MPGRRNLQRERAQHAIESPARQAALYTMLHTQLPHAEVVLIGQNQILLYLSQLGITRKNGRPLTWRMLRRWRLECGFPFLSGNSHSRRAASPFTTSFALTSWLLTRRSSDDLFHVTPPQPHDAEGKRPRITDCIAA